MSTGKRSRVLPKQDRVRSRAELIPQPRGSPAKAGSRTNIRPIFRATGTNSPATALSDSNVVFISLARTHRACDCYQSVWGRDRGASAVPDVGIIELPTRPRLESILPALHPGMDKASLPWSKGKIALSFFARTPSRCRLARRSGKRPALD